MAHPPLKNVYGTYVLRLGLFHLFCLNLSMVGFLLSSSLVVDIRKSNRVRSLDIAGTIEALLSIEVRP